MTQNVSLPVVFLHDTVVLPGMVVPIELDDQARAAIDAARLAHDASQKSDTADNEPTRVLVAPRLEDRYATHGVVAVVDRVGRFAGGRPAAVLRAERRVAIGAGVTGPGAALWVEAEPVPEAVVTDELRTLAEDYRTLVVVDPGAARGLAGDRDRATPRRPRRARRHLRLRAVPLRRPEAPAARDPRRWATGCACSSTGRGTTSPRTTSPRRSARTSARAWRRTSASSCCASSSPRSARSSARTSPTARTTTAPASRRPTSPRRSARPRCARSTSSSAPASRPRRPAGSAPGSTRSSSCRGTMRTEDNTDVAAARAVLDADHHGLDEVKDRIIEYLAVRARRAERDLEVDRRSRLRRHRGARRSSRRRQDLARRVGRPRTRPQLRARRPRRHP